MSDVMTVVLMVGRMVDKLAARSVDDLAEN